MSVEEEAELRDLVAQTLETNGCLAKIRAQLRASVFLALDEDTNVSKQQPLLNNKVKSFLDNPDGQLMFCIVREFLEYFNLDFTISVYEPESYLDSGYKYEGRQKILDDLGFDNLSCPLLLELIKIARMKSKTLDINLNFNGNSDRDEDEKDLKTASQVSSSISIELNNDNSDEHSINKWNGNKDILNGTYLVNKSNGSMENSKSSEESDIINSINSTTVGDESVNGDEKIKMKNDKLKSKDSSSPSQLNKSRVSDILPSLYSKEFKEKTNLKELEKLFDMEAEYEEDFMSGSEIELSLHSKSSEKIAATAVATTTTTTTPPSENINNSDVSNESLKINSNNG